MFNKQLLKDKIIKCNLTIEAVANCIGINPVTLYRKMNEETEFTRKEMRLISKLLKLTVKEFLAIFFADMLT